MKTTRLLLTSLIMMAVLSLGAATTEPVKTDENIECKRCLVSLGQMQEYLETGSHQHTVYWIQYIPGTCNGLAGIEGGQTATVFVENGAIVAHTDSGS